MRFTGQGLIEIFRVNFNFPIIKDDIFGHVIELDVKTAYRFVLCTNSYYLSDKYGLGLFGRFATYNHRDNSLNQGLYLVDSKTNTLIETLPYKLNRHFPFIYKGSKKIVFIESNNPSEIINKIYNKIIQSNGNSKEYIINLVHSNGSQWEHYFEFIASELFIKKGYLTDMQLPWSYRGKPDFGIYYHPIIEKLKSMKLITKGALILELSALRLFNNLNGCPDLLKNGSNGSYNQFFVGEVKTKQKKSQIAEYLKTGIPFKGYEFIPIKKKRESICGLIRIDKNHKVQIEESPENIYKDASKIKTDYKWFNNYLKVHLIANLYQSEIQELLNNKLGRCTLDFSNLIKLLSKMKLSEILRVVKNGIR